MSDTKNEHLIQLYLDEMKELGSKIIENHNQYKSCRWWQVVMKFWLACRGFDMIERYYYLKAEIIRLKTIQDE